MRNDIAHRWESRCCWPQRWRGRGLGIRGRRTMSTKTVSELVALLKDNDKDVRASAAEELGAIAPGMTEPEAEAAVPALIDALKDPDTEVRGWAADALGN